MNITKAQWKAIFKPLPNEIDPNPISDGGLPNYVFNPTGEELKHVKAMKKKYPNNVWTLKRDESTGEGTIVIVSEFDPKNRIGYIITKRAAREHISVWEEDVLKGIEERLLAGLTGKQLIQSLYEFVTHYHQTIYAKDERNKPHLDIQQAEHLLGKFGMITPGLRVSYRMQEWLNDTSRHPGLTPKETVLLGDDKMKPNEFYVLVNRIGELELYLTGDVERTVTSFKNRYASRGEAVADVYSCDHIARGVAPLYPTFQNLVTKCLAKHYPSYRAYRQPNGPEGDPESTTIHTLNKTGFEISIFIPPGASESPEPVLYWHVLIEQEQSSTPSNSALALVM